MRFKKAFQSGSISFSNGTAEHWKDAKELHQVMHSLPGFIKALLLDLMDNPMTHDEVLQAIKNIEMRVSGSKERKSQNTDIAKDIDFAIQCRVLEKKDEKYVLTPGGQEIAQHMKEVIPLFFNSLLSTKMVSITTIIIHVLLSIVKLVFGILSRSAGLMADGIDNTVDTISSVLVWFGIKYKKDKLVSLFIIIMMVISCGGIVIASVRKLLHPVAVKEGLLAFIVSAVSGFTMLILSCYQYITGKKTANFAILCQSVDARNHFFTSLLVCMGILTSYIADVFNQSWLYYSDAVVAIIIGILIMKSSLELIVEFLKPENETTHVSHFVEKARQNMKMKIVWQWLSNELEENSMSYEELRVRFDQYFCEQTPKIHMLTGIGYLPKTSSELQYFLDKLLKKKKVVLHDNKYSLFFNHY